MKGLVFSLLFLWSMANALAATPCPEFSPELSAKSYIFGRLSEEDLDEKFQAEYDETIQGLGIAPASDESHGLTKAQKIALFAYTNTLYEKINTGLRNGGRDLDSVALMVEVLHCGLSKLPPFKGKVIRGSNLPPDVDELYTTGEIVSDPAFLSSTSNSVLSRNFGKMDYEFTIESKSGKKIKDFSIYPNENEVLFLPNTKFKVVARKDFRFKIEIELVEED